LKDTSRVSEIEPQLSPGGSKMPAALPDLTPQPADQSLMQTGTPTVPKETVKTPTTTPNLPPRPQFSYDDINTANLATIGNLCTTNDQVCFHICIEQIISVFTHVYFHSCCLKE
jgi:hypothetical protein